MQQMKSRLKKKIITITGTATLYINRLSAQADGNAGINEANTKVRGYFAAGTDLIRKAQCAFDGVAPNRYTDALFSLGDVLCYMFAQLRV